MALPSVLPFQPVFNYPNNKLYQYEVYPVLLTCSFTVDSTNALGITGLIGSGIANVFMHTSTTAGAGNYGAVNPNPNSGVIEIQLQNQFSRLLRVDSMVQSPVTGSSLTATTANAAYRITALGTATLAQWQAKGLPAGVTPAVGSVFIASASGTIGGSAAVKALGSSNSGRIELIGSNLQNSNVYQNGGGTVLLQCFSNAVSGTISAPVLTMNSYTPAGTNDSGTPPIFTGTPAVLTGSVSAPTFTSTSALSLSAPVDGSIITLSFYLSNSSVAVNGL